MRDRLLPSVRERMRRRHGTATFWYGNFRNQDPDSLAAGWETYDARPRFGTNWMGLRGKMAVLSEGYSNADFRTRVTATYDFVHEVLSCRGRAAERPCSPRSRRLSGTARRLGGRALGARPADAAGRGGRDHPPRRRRQRRLRPADAQRGLSDHPHAGVRPVRRPRAGRPCPRPTCCRPGSATWPRCSGARESRSSGFASRGPAQAERFTVDTVRARAAVRGAPAGARSRATGAEQRPLTADAGWFLVRTDQPLGVLAAYLLEPASEDGLATWNLLDRELQPHADLSDRPRPRPGARGRRRAAHALTDHEEIHARARRQGPAIHADRRRPASRSRSRISPGATSSCTSIPRTTRPGCTKEACGFRDAWNELQELGVAVLGVSADDAASHTKFAAKYRLPFTLLSDPDHTVMTAYGAYGEKTMYGKKVVGVIRSTVWIGPDGRVRRHWPRVANAAEHPDKVLAALREGLLTGSTSLYLNVPLLIGSTHDRAPHRHRLAHPRSARAGWRVRWIALAPPSSGLWEWTKSIVVALVVWFFLRTFLRGGVPDSVGQHGEHAADRRLPVREQGAVRRGGPAHPHAPSGGARARTGTTSWCSTRSRKRGSRSSSG